MLTLNNYDSTKDVYAVDLVRSNYFSASLIGQTWPKYSQSQLKIKTLRKLHNRKNSTRGLEADEKKQALDLHNKLRAKIARGDEIRGRPGPQPNAANMMQMVIFISFGAIYFWGCL